MKRLILTICLCLLVASPAFAWMGAVGVGASGGSAAECVEATPNTQDTQNDFWNLGGSATKKYIQTPYVAGGSNPIRTVYVKLRKNGSPTFTVTLSLCATSNGSTEIGTCTNADTESGSPLDSSTLTTSYIDYKFHFSDGYAQTAETVYHIRLMASSIGDSSNNVMWGANSSGPTGCYYDADGFGAFSPHDSSCQHDFILKNCTE